MRRDDQTEMGGGQAAFLTTQWSLIEVVGGDDEDRDRVLIGALLQRYWKPVYCFLRRRGYGNEEAKDLTQSFFHEVVLGRHLIQRADRSKGRFRCFLLVALRNYVAATREKDCAQKRMPGGTLIPLEMADESRLSTACMELTPEDSFNYVWVSALFEHVLQEVKNACYEDGKTVHWHLFRDRVLGPIMDAVDPPTLNDLCHKYGIKDPTAASNMVVTVKRRFRTVIRTHLRTLVSSDDEVDCELAEIMQFLPKVTQDRP
jgi:RNA polymerase sigma-70 factor (ECF subfamily)